MSTEDTPKDQSMEEILQSIKRIIAEDEESPENSDDSAKSENSESSGSEILELVNEVETDEQNSEKNEPTSIEDLIDSVVKPQEEDSLEKTTEEKTEIEDIFPTEVESDTQAEIPPEPELKAVDISEQKSDDNKENSESSDTLLSQVAASASSQAFDELLEVTTPKETKPTVLPDDFRSGNTVEDLVLESLKPLLKEWLDDNLPALVSRLVKREIEKITHRY